MQLAILPSTVDLSRLERLAGASSYARGVQYARKRAVLHMEWDDGHDELRGVVSGSSGVYLTSASFGGMRQGAPVFLGGQCSCPMEIDCKHVVALVLTASPGERVQPTPRRPEQVATWQQTLDRLFASEPVGARSAAATPLAIQLTLTGDGPDRRTLKARLVRPGKSGWVAGGLGWSRLAIPGSLSEHSAEQVRLLSELRAIHHARSQQSGYYPYGYSYEEKMLDLTSCDSLNLWPLLDQAAESGIQLVHSRAALGPVDPYGHAELTLDVTRDEEAGCLVVAPVVRDVGDGRRLWPVAFIGAQGHGAVFAEEGEADLENRPIRLARFARPVPVEVQQMALRRASVRVPLAESTRFNEHFYPRLRRLAPVMSPDGSVSLPEISPPTLVLRADYGDDHELELGWEWAYQIGDSSARAPLHDGAREADHYRDAAAEQALLADLAHLFNGHGPIPAPSGGLPPRPAGLHGVDTMRFTTELLPWLEQQTGLAVEISGQPADYREAGDSLRIGVSADRGDDADWFDLGVTLSIEGTDVPLTSVISAMALDEPYLLLPDGAYFSLDKPVLRMLRRLVEEARLLQDKPGPLRISRYQAGLWQEFASLGVVERQAQAWKQQVDGLLTIDAVRPVDVPTTLHADLRPYQHDGFQWLSFLWRQQLGGVFADDMGLGKTLQSLTLICHARQTDPTAPPFLIVAPTSVVPNWAAEAARFAPGLRVATITDTRRRRARPLAESIAGADLVVTSYAVFRIDSDDYSTQAWSGLLLDEAQQVKNHLSKTYQAARRLAAPFKVAITGTPFENNLMELWSLLSITAPGLFPSPVRFKDYYARPIEKQHDTELLAQLRQRVKPLVKRRTKEQVLAELPAKQEQVLEVELHPKHRTIYDRHLQRERQKVLGLIDDMDKNRFTILRSLTLLRQLSLHAGLVDDLQATIPSAKIDLLMAQLHDVVDSGHRALIFSQFTRFLGIVRDRVRSAGMDHCYLDGRTRSRQDVLTTFKQGSAPVFLISLKAGGFGLNLTEADYCFLLDPWWNPATEAQAIDRTHRIGQTRNVMVYRLIAKDTIEHKVMALQERKAALFASVMDDGNMFGSSLTADEVRGLFA